MYRNARQAKILEIIGRQEIETQEELCAELNKLNFNVTQATVSRDIKELRLYKVAGSTKKYKYVGLDGAQEELSPRMLNLFRESVLSINYANNIIVIKTLRGNGQVCGEIAGVEVVYDYNIPAEQAAVELAFAYVYTVNFARAGFEQTVGKAARACPDIGKHLAPDVERKVAKRLEKFIAARRNKVHALLGVLHPVAILNLVRGLPRNPVHQNAAATDGRRSPATGAVLFRGEFIQSHMFFSM